MRGKRKCYWFKFENTSVVKDDKQKKQYPTNQMLRNIFWFVTAAQSFWPHDRLVISTLGKVELCSSLRTLASQKYIRRLSLKQRWGIPDPSHNPQLAQTEIQVIHEVSHWQPPLTRTKAVTLTGSPTLSTTRRTTAVLLSLTTKSVWPRKRSVADSDLVPGMDRASINPASRKTESIPTEEKM